MHCGFSLASAGPTTAAVASPCLAQASRQRGQCAGAGFSQEGASTLDTAAPGAAGRAPDQRQERAARAERENGGREFHSTRMGVKRWPGTLPPASICSAWASSRAVAAACFGIIVGSVCPLADTGAAAGGAAGVAAARSLAARAAATGSAGGG